MYKVIVCGSRLYDDRDTLNSVLDALYAKRGHKMLLMTGGAVGADELARQWACSRKVNHLVLYANWEVEGKGAGPIRNRRLLGFFKKGPRLVVAFRVNKKGENRGTDDMISIAEGAGIRVKKVS